MEPKNIQLSQIIRQFGGLGFSVEDKKVKIPKDIVFVGDEKFSEFCLWSTNFKKLSFFCAKLTKLKKKDKYKGKGVRDVAFFFIKKEIRKK